MSFAYYNKHKRDFRRHRILRHCHWPKKEKRAIIVIVSLLASRARREWRYDRVITSYYVSTTELLQTLTGMYTFVDGFFVKHIIDFYTNDGNKKTTVLWRWRFNVFIAAADFLLTLCHASVSDSLANKSHPSSTVTTRYLTHMLRYILSVFKTLYGYECILWIIKLVERPSRVRHFR